MCSSKTNLLYLDFVQSFHLEILFVLGFSVQNSLNTGKRCSCLEEGFYIRDRNLKNISIEILRMSSKAFVTLLLFS